MGAPLGTPVLFCDSRVVGRLLSGGNEWRAKALVNRAMGARNLIELTVPSVRFKATLGTQAGALTKFIGGNILPRQRELVGCVPL